MNSLLLLTLSVLAYANASPYVEMVPIDDHVRSLFDISHMEIKGSRPEGSVAPAATELEALVQRNAVANTIRELLESFRHAIEHGSDSHPPLDPLQIDQLGPFSFRTDGIPSIRATVEARNLNAEGLKWYVVDDVTFNLLRLLIGFQMTVPGLTFTGDYDAQARFALFITHNAAGSFRVFVNRLEVGGDMRLGVSVTGGGHLVLRDLNLKLDIHDTSVHIGGLVESGFINAILNWVVQNVTQDVVQSNLEELSNFVSDIVFDIVNEILKGFTMDDLIN